MRTRRNRGTPTLSEFAVSSAFARHRGDVRIALLRYERTISDRGSDWDWCLGLVDDSTIVHAPIDGGEPAIVAVYGSPLDVFLLLTRFRQGYGHLFERLPLHESDGTRYRTAPADEWPVELQEAIFFSRKAEALERAWHATVDPIIPKKGTDRSEQSHLLAHRAGRPGESRLAARGARSCPTRLRPRTATSCHPTRHTRRSGEAPRVYQDG